MPESQKSIAMNANPEQMGPSSLGSSALFLGIVAFVGNGAFGWWLAGLFASIAGLGLLCLLGFVIARVRNRWNWFCAGLALPLNLLIVSAPWSPAIMEWNTYLLIGIWLPW